MLWGGSSNTNKIGHSIRIKRKFYQQGGREGMKANQQLDEKEAKQFWRKYGTKNNITVRSNGKRITRTQRTWSRQTPKLT